MEGQAEDIQLFSDLPSSLTKYLIRKREEAYSGSWRTAQEKTNQNKGQCMARQGDGLDTRPLQWNRRRPARSDPLPAARLHNRKMLQQTAPAAKDLKVQTLVACGIFPIQTAPPAQGHFPEATASWPPAKCSLYKTTALANFKARLPAGNTCLNKAFIVCSSSRAGI